VSISLRSDTAAALTHAIVEKFNWDREEQMAEAYRELLPVVTAGLTAYDHFRHKLRRRLKPLETAKEDPDAAE
jgi:hypothetical protein